MISFERDSKTFGENGHWTPVSLGAMLEVLKAYFADPDAAFEALARGEEISSNFFIYRATRESLQGITVESLPVS